MVPKWRHIFPRVLKAEPGSCGKVFATVRFNSAESVHRSYDLSLVIFVAVQF